MRLGIDPKQADQIVRGSVVLPHGIGRSQRSSCLPRVIWRTRPSGRHDEVGQEDLAEKIKGGWLDFDVCIAAPDMMGWWGPRPCPRSPRIDAIAAGRHGHPDVAKWWANTRRERSSSATMRAATSTPWSAN